MLILLGAQLLPPNQSYIKGCQNCSISKLPDILSILIGCLLEDEQEGEPVIVRDEQFSDEGLTDDEWKNHVLLEETIGSMVTAKSACLLRLGALDPTSASNKGKESIKCHEKVTIATTDTTLQVRQLTLNGTCVLVTRLCKHCMSCKNSFRRPGTNLKVFQTGSSSRACSTTSPTGKVGRCRK